MSQETVQKLISGAGITFNGDQPWDPKIHDERFYDRFLAHGNLGAGEAYMEGWWDCEQLDELIHRAFRANLTEKIISWRMSLDMARAKLFNRQGKSKAFLNASRHYDIGNDLYERMLDRRMNYSCAYWQGASNLDEAQVNKLELICKKIDLKPGMNLLDIGCGWGGLVKYVAERYDVKCVGITVSQNQFKTAKESCEGLPVEIRHQDYRDLDQKFDRIVSVGMFEHVGYKNYSTFMRVVNRCLKEDGVFLLHTIGANKSTARIDPWIHRYIFPNSMIPSVKQIGNAAERLFVMEDWHNFGPDYDRTLMAWYKNFESHWKELQPKYGDDFFRMWRYYLLSCAGTFRARENQVWQILFSKKGIPVRPYR